jgi:hypothetical protein
LHIQLSQWIYQQFNSLTHRFVLIGENDLETSRLLKEHLDFANSVNVWQSNSSLIHSFFIHISEDRSELHSGADSWKTAFGTAIAGNE